MGRYSSAEAIIDNNYQPPLPHLHDFYLLAIEAIMKRAREGNDESERPRKVIRVPAVDRLSRLSDELLVRILSFSSVPTLLTCQRYFCLHAFTYNT